MPDHPPSPTACVVGAGPAGLLLALLLGRSGHRVTVLERSPRIDLTRQAGAPVLQPVTLRILERAGLLDELRRGAGEIRSGEVSVRGREVARYAYRDLPGVPLPFALTVPVTTLRGALLDAVGELPGVELRLGAEVTRLEGGTGARREIVVRDGAGTHVLRPRFVVGCDGKFSTVRRLAGVPAHVFSYDRGYLDFLVPAPPDWGPRITMHFSDDAYVLSMPYPGNRLIVVWITREQRVDAALAAPFAGLAGTLTAAAPELAEVFTPPVTTRDWAGVPHRQVQHHRVRPDRWLDGNVLLIGDSAHAMHAFGGQGLNTSLQDAAWAAEGIARATDSGSLEYLEEVLRLRVPFIEDFQEMQRVTLVPQSGEQAPQHGTALPDFLPMVLGQPELRPLWAGVSEGARL
ncbi:FAD-dependent oxidoreductase [Streptomyces alkaliphilus]|uniref:FAD-dependent oxidoreductase n=1 Tax=Streptomyces alkaliphilus TaxID=1472722 RepID=UPI00117E77AA|nr:NAD(P)/FAD-dependent oxidoreductase [Streptomyces alkaliphilus]MQS06038.1 NAD(P)-binding protein [Streptomyces alkaliphilus]